MERDMESERGKCREGAGLKLGWSADWPLQGFRTPKTTCRYISSQIKTCWLSQKLDKNFRTQKDSNRWHQVSQSMLLPLLLGGSRSSGRQPLSSQKGEIRRKARANFEASKMKLFGGVGKSYSRHVHLLDEPYRMIPLTSQEPISAWGPRLLREVPTMQSSVFADRTLIITMKQSERIETIVEGDDEWERDSGFIQCVCMTHVGEKWIVF